MTSRDAKTVRRASWGLDTSDRYFDKEHFETKSKVMAQIVVFVFLVSLTLTFDLCSIFFVTRIAHDVRVYAETVSGIFGGSKPCLRPTEQIV